MEQTWNPPPLFFSLSDPFLQKPSALAGKAPRPSGVKPVCVWGAPAELGALLCSVIALHPTLWRCLGAQEIDKSLVLLVGNLPTSFVLLRKENVLNKVWWRSNPRFGRGALQNVLCIRAPAGWSLVTWDLALKAHNFRSLGGAFEAAVTRYCVPGHCWMPVVTSCHVFCADCEAGSWDCQTGCSPQLGLFPQLLVGRCLDSHIIAIPAWPHAPSKSTMGLSDAASRAIGPGWMVFWARFTHGPWFL